MTVQHFLRGVGASVLLVVFGAIGGCSTPGNRNGVSIAAAGKSPVATSAAAPDSTPSGAASGPNASTPTPGSPDDLARRTSGYVQDMAAQINRPVKPAPARMSPPTVDPENAGTASDVAAAGNQTNAQQPPSPIRTATPPDAISGSSASAVAPSAAGPAPAASARPVADATPRASQVQWGNAPPAAPGAGDAPLPGTAPPVRTVVVASPPVVHAVVPVVSAPAHPAARFPIVLPESADLPGGSSDGGIGLQSSDTLERRLAQQIKDDPRDTSAQLDYQLLEFVKGRATPDMNAVAGLPAEDREIVTAMMDALGNFRSAVRSDSNMLLARKIRPIVEMADRLRGEADLTIPVIALCAKVDGFGNYKLIDSKFPAGRENPVIVYCEVENFASELNESQLWETKLTQEAVLYTDTGIRVWAASPAATPIVDQCRNRRHDFFVINILHLPATLAPGRYLLKVTLTDQLANRVAEATAQAQIIGD